jgi:hypothetical protein
MITEEDFAAAADGPPDMAFVRLERKFRQILEQNLEESQSSGASDHFIIEYMNHTLAAAETLGLDFLQFYTVPDDNSSGVYDSYRRFRQTVDGFILNQLGQFHSGHRAIDDCTALFNILKAPLVGTDGSVFAEILSCARKTRYRISVVSPYELRNALKARGYRWYPGGSGRPRSWWIEASEERQTEELNFLFRESRLPRDRILVERLTALNRYKSIESPSLRRDTW